ncbi:CDP-glycerol glycerophosphotransferase family protein [Jeotgalibacillus haloalkalitolerans]|uniref:CDP-glycerol glycerophosphotransferase family protein n=1 Tax=Jeotgalibacillus haloalkalitolerans TaxID=3104292 RepID=A0ABU5KJ75_9BACL|nr:CDP-glycerol glycerophosphotransferase family protein [Jeotgalibacillus sp. HH7-29]MDZ5711293.1 CDP-glycerol glycerophosphotransferase family protein [Jeotgalibacillus sp. HH7-29]
MESNTSRVLRVSKRVLRKRAGKLKQKMLKSARSEVAATNLTLKDGLLTIEGTAKFLHYTNEGKNPISLSLADAESKKTIIRAEAIIDTVMGHILPVKKSTFSASFNLKKYNENGELNGRKLDVFLHFKGFVNRTYRLYIPVKKLSNGFMNDYNRDNQAIYYPYRTSYGNLSILILSNNDQERLKTIPNLLTGYQMNNGELSLSGWFDSDFLSFFDLNPEDLSLVVKRRGSANNWESEINVTGEHWKAKVNIYDINFSKGVWDFYLSLKKGHMLLHRIRLSNNEVFNENRTFYVPAEKESLKGVCYRTKQNGFSVNIQATMIRATSLEIENLNGDIQFRTNFSKSGLNLSEDQTLKALTLTFIQRDTNQEVSFPLNYELNQLSTHVQTACSFKYNDILDEFGITKKIWDAYLDVETNTDRLRMRIKARSRIMSQTSKQNYFKDQSMYSMYFYQTIYKRLSLVYSLVPLRRTVSDYRFDKLNLILQGKAYIDSSEFENDSATILNIVAKNRVTEEEIFVPCKKLNSGVLKRVLGKAQAKGINFEVEISLIELQGLIDTAKDIIDFYIEASTEKVTRREKIGLKKYRYYKDDVLAATELPSKYEGVDISYCLTITPRGNLKIETFKLEKRFKESLLSVKGEEEIWLIGERPDTAQDTGYHFFRYCRRNFPDQPVYYAINGDSKDLKNIEHLGNVLIAGTPEHFEIASKAKVLIGSHDFDYFLPFKGIQSPGYKDTVKVFLQHGVLGRKKVEYNKKFYKYPFDIFCVSSTDEKHMVMDQQGYTDQDVRVTGLSRFDQLLQDHNPKREILLIPTWREWLNTTDALLESEYLKRYTGFLKNPRLLELLKKHNLKLNFYPHYRMQQFFDEFGTDFDPSINLIKLGEKNVQDLLKDNALMITDFSSVSFDFTYLSKPVIFYHFDRDSFFKGGIMRPFDETFLGDVASEEDQMISYIEKSIENNFAEKEDVKDKKGMIFDYVDQHNCERIYSEIQRAIKEKAKA